MRQEFCRISIDTTTYSKLTALAKANQVTRSEYVRRLINAESNKLLDTEAEKILANMPKKSAVPDNATIVMYDEANNPVTFGELDPIRQAITVLYEFLRLGPLDTKGKLKRKPIEVVNG